MGTDKDSLGPGKRAAQAHGLLALVKRQVGASRDRRARLIWGSVPVVGGDLSGDQEAVRRWRLFPACRDISPENRTAKHFLRFAPRLGFGLPVEMGDRM